MTEWIPVSRELPDMNTDVIVWGRIPKNNTCRQAYEARRWTNSKPEDFCMWLTPCDFEVTDVTHWMKMPKETLPK